MMTNLTIGGLVVMNFSRSLLLMTTLFLVFAKRLCSLFPEFSFYFVLNSKVDQLSRKQQKKKVELKKEMERKSHLLINISPIKSLFCS
jgi:Tfp pilus assembly protein PilO